MTAPPYTEGRRRTYGDIEAVQGLDLTVAAGESFGFMGPDGTGRSTTISVPCALPRPTAGSAEGAGVDVVRDPAAERAEARQLPLGAGWP
ncbi:ATP-binding cassette domain-containing protein [Micromonospora matsumotoense]|uniref:ATP-binding cassette domain-containing protein n=1 Tax=Micromonospora matsumotoense TaxID=121616 RepID=UPI003D8BE1E8